MIDLVITDVVTPKMSGPRLARNLASLRPDLKVLFVSGYADDTVCEKALATLPTTSCRSPSRCGHWPENIREVLEQPALARATAAGAV